MLNDPVIFNGSPLLAGQVRITIVPLKALHSSMSSSLAADLIRIQSCVCCLFWTNRNSMAVTSIFLSISLSIDPIRVMNPSSYQKMEIFTSTETIVFLWSNLNKITIFSFWTWFFFHSWFLCKSDLVILCFRSKEEVIKIKYFWRQENNIIFLIIYQIIVLKVSI